MYDAALSLLVCIANTPTNSAGCVRTSQAGTKLDRTQTAEGLLWSVMTMYCIAQWELINSHKRKCKIAHGNRYWSSWCFWHRRYGRMLIDPVPFGLLKP
jgi:hypothetical protein